MNKINKIILSFLLSFITFFFLNVSQQAYAHVISYQAIHTSLKAKGNEISITSQVAFSFDYGSTDKQARLAELTNYFSNDFLIEQNKISCSVVIENISIDTKAPKTVFSGRYVCPKEVGDIQTLRISNYLFEEFFNPYDNFVDFESHGKVSSLVFTQAKQIYPDNVSLESLFDVLWKFMQLGMAHILSGIDHILFLLAVVLILPSFKKITTLVTSFTVAHSITLISSVLGLIVVSPKFVEPVIALSIAVMAFRNIWILKTKKQVILKERWAVVFGFGLFHGLGFAGALAQTEIPRQYFLPSLLSFNAGIEVGQFMVLAVVVPYLILMRKWRFRPYFLYGASIAITVVALFWVVQRILTLWIK